MLPVRNSICTMATVPGVEVTQQQSLLHSELLQKWWKECKKVKDFESQGCLLPVLSLLENSSP